MNREEIISQIRSKKTFLCVGLDPEIEKLPKHLPKSALGVKEFCLNIIEQTKNHCVSYKLNSAFFETLGWEGYKVMQEIITEIPTSHFIIADAKRGDIGNTSTQYAKAFLENMNCDGITVSPYMGSDSIQPFLNIPNKWTIILGITSNKGSEDFELLKIENQFLYEIVMQKCLEWGTIENTMLVVRATHIDNMSKIRAKFPHHFFLVPGIGAQGGSLEQVCKSLINNDIGILVSSSREIIYASNDINYAEMAGKIAMNISKTMSTFIS